MKCSVQDCGDLGVARGLCNKHYLRWSKYGSPDLSFVRTKQGTIPFIEDSLQRWWSYVQKGADGQCWPWIGVLSNGYGMFKDGRRTSYAASRWGHERLIGPIPDGTFVCHTCDTPACCNPSHWFLGTCQDNLDDMRAKGRGPVGLSRDKQHQPKGENHVNAKLTWDQVRAIRSERATVGTSYRELAARYSVTFGLIGSIVRGRGWKE